MVKKSKHSFVKEKNNKSFLISIFKFLIYLQQNGQFTVLIIRSDNN